MLIDRTTGDIHVSESIVLRRGLSRRGWATSGLGRSACPLPRNPYWFVADAPTLPVEAEDGLDQVMSTQQWMLHWSPSYSGERMETVYLSVRPANEDAKLTAWSTEREMVLKGLHDTLLRADLGPGHEETSGMRASVHAFDWGVVRSVYDEISGQSLIQVRWSDCPNATGIKRTLPGTTKPRVPTRQTVPQPKNDPSLSVPFSALFMQFRKNHVATSTTV